MTENKKKWTNDFENYMDNFGLVKFAEVNSLNMNDFERAFKHYASVTKKGIQSCRKFGEYQFGEIDNELISDYTESFKHYFK